MDPNGISLKRDCQYIILVIIGDNGLYTQHTSALFCRCLDFVSEWMFSSERLVVSVER